MWEHSNKRQGHSQHYFKNSLSFSPDLGFHGNFAQRTWQGGLCFCLDNLHREQLSFNKCTNICINGLLFLNSTAKQCSPSSETWILRRASVVLSVFWNLNRASLRMCSSVTTVLSRRLAALCAKKNNYMLCIQIVCCAGIGWRRTWMQLRMSPVPLQLQLYLFSKGQLVLCQGIKRACKKYRRRNKWIKMN